MNLIQRGTTASRANRGKSVNDSIAQRNGAPSYRRKRLFVSLIPGNLYRSYPEWGGGTHLTSSGTATERKVANQAVLG